MYLPYFLAFLGAAGAAFLVAATLGAFLTTGVASSTPIALAQWFGKLDFAESIKSNERIILEAMGIPPILMDGGNNANIRPNHRLYYLETVLPVVKKLGYALERFFGFSLNEDVTGIPALQPELRDQAAYYATLVNTGIMTPNEARTQLGREPLEGHDDLRVPANIAGSAANPTEGGKPPQEEEQDNGEQESDT